MSYRFILTSQNCSGHYITDGWIGFLGIIDPLSKESSKNEIDLANTKYSTVFTHLKIYFERPSAIMKLVIFINYPPKPEFFSGMRCGYFLKVISTLHSDLLLIYDGTLHINFVIRCQCRGEICCFTLASSNVGNFCQKTLFFKGDKWDRR